MAPEKGIEDNYATTNRHKNEYDARVVAQIHRNADTDADKVSIHHTIGPGSNQVASGIHNHDGSDTRALLDGVNLTGAKAGNAALASVVAALVALGATDSTSA
jgi:hypothetical protein